MALTRTVESLLSSVPGLQARGEALSKGLHRLVLRGGRPARRVADLLHGTWLGHPLHPVLTDVTVGAYALSALFDVLSVFRGTRFAEETADRLLAIGNASAVPTALTGLADYSGVQQPAVSAATVHGLLNTVNLALYLLSQHERRQGRRGRGMLLSSLALLLSGAAAWLGGHLVYRLNVGTDHTEAGEGPDDWTAVLDAADLADGAARRVEVDDQPILIFRRDEAVFAVGAVCSHAGAPLEEGTFDGVTVTCPWHDSVFDLRDGCVLHGPATHPQPAYEARLSGGQVEVRLLAR